MFADEDRVPVYPWHTLVPFLGRPTSIQQPLSSHPFAPLTLANLTNLSTEEPDARVNIDNAVPAQSHIYPNFQFINPNKSMPSTEVSPQYPITSSLTHHRRQSQSKASNVVSLSPSVPVTSSAVLPPGSTGNTVAGLPVSQTYTSPRYSLSATATDSRLKIGKSASVSIPACKLIYSSFEIIVLPIFDVTINNLANHCQGVL